MAVGAGIAILMLVEGVDGGLDLVQVGRHKEGLGRVREAAMLTGRSQLLLLLGGGGGRGDRVHLRLHLVHVVALLLLLLLLLLLEGGKGGGHLLLLGELRELGQVGKGRGCGQESGPATAAATAATAIAIAICRLV